MNTESNVAFGKIKVMRISEIPQNKLKQGVNIIFATKDKDDYREAELSFTMRSGFVIWFNGTIIARYNTFHGLINRMNRLNEKWDLEFIEER